MTVALTPHNTIIGVRLESRLPAFGAHVEVPPALPDFGSDADLMVERQLHAATRQERDAALAEVARLQALVAKKSATSSTQATRAWLRFERVTLDLTGETIADVLARMEADDLEYEFERAATIRIQRASVVARAYYTDKPDKVVVSP